MKFNKVLILSFLLCFPTWLVFATNNKTQPQYNRSQGFYKDVFMDSGLALTSRRTLPACRALGLSMEYFVSASTSKKAKNPANEVDTLLQKMIMVGNPLDYNGVLLYPDGAPRFRMIYVNGGISNSHGYSLKKAGRNIMKTFVANGGGYVGSCAGAYFASQYVLDKDSLIEKSMYLGIWPGCVRQTGLKKAYNTISIEKNSKLLSYGFPNGIMKVDSVRHNGGCYAETKVKWPKGTEILARLSMPKTDPRHDLDGKPIIWAYKASPFSGRIIQCGSHPESVASEERLDLVTSMFRYAMDGNPTPQIKGELLPGQTREMNRHTKDKVPAYTRIGDKQYHHFTLCVPKKCEKLEITLGDYKGWRDFDLFLFASNTGFAFSDTAQYRNVRFGVAKKITIDNPKEGVYYISVFCDTTVNTTESKYGTMYTGRIDVLNGVPYSIKAEITVGQ
ncbi:MAG: hypothetical protein KBS95_08045 [Alistipes sp.]|nr:hypothetical protein [Candidatus Alistipes equi]